MSGLNRTEQLSRAIATAKEPEPTFKSVGYIGCLSMLGWYVWDRWAWTPRSITEPEIAMRLLKEMGDLEIANFDEGSVARVKYGYEYKVAVYGATGTESAGRGPSLELAIAEAYVRAFGIEVAE